MKKELGKWLMDIAKYVTTAIILASFIGGFEDLWLIYLVSIIVAIVTLGTGLMLVKDSNNNNNNKKK